MAERPWGLNSYRRPEIQLIQQNMKAHWHADSREPGFAAILVTLKDTEIWFHRATSPHQFKSGKTINNKQLLYKFTQEKFAK